MGLGLDGAPGHQATRAMNRFPSDLVFGRSFPTVGLVTVGAGFDSQLYIPGPSNRSPRATFRSAKASRGDLLEGAGIYAYIPLMKSGLTHERNSHPPEHSGSSRCPKIGSMFSEQKPGPMGFPIESTPVWNWSQKAT